MLKGLKLFFPHFGDFPPFGRFWNHFLTRSLTQEITNTPGPFASHAATLRQVALTFKFQFLLAIIPELWQAGL